MVVLVRGSPGACVERVLAEFEEAYQLDPMSVCLVVPSRGLARSLRSCLTSDGKTLVNTSVTTLSELATERLSSCPHAPFVLTPMETEAVIRQIMVAMKDELPLFYSDGELRQGLIPAVRAFISSTLEFDVDYPADLGGLQSERSRQLAIIRNAYLDTLHGKNRIDQKEMLSWTAQDLIGQKTWIKKLFFLGMFEPKPNEKSMIIALCGVCSDSTFYTIHSSNSPAFKDNHSWLNPESVEELEWNHRDSILSGVFRTKDGSEEASVCVGSFLDARDEMRAMASRIRGLLDDGVEPEEIGVLLPMRSKSAPLLREVLKDFDIPANIRVPIRLSESPIVQTITNILGMPSNNYMAEDLVSLLSSPYVRFKFKVGGEEKQLYAGSVRSFAKRNGIKGGKERWLAPIESMPGDSEAAEDADATVRSGVKALMDVLEGLEGEKTASGHIKTLKAVLDHLEIGKHQYFQDSVVMRRWQRALKVYFELQKDLDNASRLFSKDKISLEVFTGLHRTLVAGEEFYPDPNDDKAVLVTGLRAGQLIRFKHLFIPSMVEVDIPRVNVLNPFIPEGEVRELGLLSGEDILRHERYYFLTALMSSGDRVYLSTHRNEDDRPVLPSVFLDAVERAVRCDQLPPEDQARSRSGAQRLLGQAIAGNEVQLSSRPFGSDIDASCLAINVEEFKRDGPYRTEYDGMLSGDEVLADVAGFHSDRTYSASQVNMFSNCPFRFYLSYHMRLRPDRDDDEASPLNYGNAVHTVLQRFYTERCSAGRAKLSEAEREHAIERVREIAKEEAAKGTSVSWQTYMNHFVGVGHPGVASMFIDFELKDKLPSLSPRWIELCYGPHALEGGDPTSVPDPVEIPLDDDGSRKMKMECRIDRVDSDNRGNFFVLDYKTGSPKGKAVAANDLQIPLYILAMEAAVPGSRGIGGGFFYLGGKKNTKIVPTVRDRDYSEMMARLGKIYKSEWGRDSLDALRTQSLGAWLDAMSRGRFNLSMSGTVRPGTDCGPRCEFYGACRFDKGRAIEIGLGNNEIEEADE